MFKVVFMFLNLFSLAVLGLPTNAQHGLTADVGGVVVTGFDSAGAMLTLHASNDCSGDSQGSFYLLSAQPIWNNPIGQPTLSISVGSNSGDTQIDYYDQNGATGNMLGSTTGNNVCARFSKDIRSAKLVLNN